MAPDSTPIDRSEEIATGTLNQKQVEDVLTARTLEDAIAALPKDCDYPNRAAVLAIRGVPTLTTQQIGSLGFRNDASFECSLEDAPFITHSSASLMISLEMLDAPDHGGEEAIKRMVRKWFSMLPQAAKQTALAKLDVLQLRYPDSEEQSDDSDDSGDAELKLLNTKLLQLGKIAETLHEELSQIPNNEPKTAKSSNPTKRQQKAEARYEGEDLGALLASLPDADADLDTDPDVELDRESARIAWRLRNGRRAKIGLALGGLALLAGLGVMKLKGDFDSRSAGSPSEIALGLSNDPADYLTHENRKALAERANPAPDASDRDASITAAMADAPAPIVEDTKTAAAEAIAEAAPKAEAAPQAEPAPVPPAEPPVPATTPDTTVTAPPEAPAAPAPAEAPATKVRVTLVLYESAMGGIRIDPVKTAATLGAFTLVSANKDGNVVLTGPSGETYLIPIAALQAAPRIGEVEFEASAAPKAE